MTIIIFEGIATSGKSTMIAKLRGALTGRGVLVADESQTHEPIMEQTNELHIAFFEKLINQLAQDRPDVLIFDRLYLTQAFRANVSLDQYAQIENKLAKHQAFTVFLKVDEAAIAKRVKEASEHRDPAWKKYLESKGDTLEEIAQYYIAQQQSQLKLLETSTLPYLICDTTSHNYDEAIERVIKLL